MAPEGPHCLDALICFYCSGCRPVHSPSGSTETVHFAQLVPAEHRPVFTTSTRLEDFGHPETGFRQPEQSRSLFRTDILEPSS